MFHFCLAIATRNNEVEDKEIDDFYPLPVAVCIVRLLVEELRRPRLHSSRGMAWLARPPRQRSAGHAGFCWFLFAIPRRYWGRGAFAWMQGCTLALRARLVV
jgi:hypothetical protein